MPRVVLALGLAALPAVSRAETSLRISAAVSLAPAIEEAAREFAAERPGLDYRINAAASGILLQQARHGFPADLLVSASAEEIDRLVSHGLADRQTRRVVAGNRLVILVPVGSPAPRTAADLTGEAFDRIAIGNPATAPLGRRSREALVALGLWPALEPRLVYGESARQVLDYVARGEVAAGLTYLSDARISPSRVSVAAEIPAASHRPIVYEGVVLSGAAEPAVARAFLHWLAGPAGRETLSRHGFSPP